MYLLDSIIDDLRSDDKREFKATNNGYLFISKVNYPNNKLLVKQKVYTNKKEEITKIEVVDKDDNVQIIMNFSKIVYDKKMDKDDFKLNKLLNNNPSQNRPTPSPNPTNNEEVEQQADSNKTESTANIKDIVYPMYLPDNTYLTKQESIDTGNGNRLILTFGGDSSFVLVEETANYSNEAMIIPVSGDFTFLSDVIGIINNNSIMWQTGGIDYYLASDTIETSELLDIARSISVLPVSK